MQLLIVFSYHCLLDGYSNVCSFLYNWLSFNSVFIFLTHLKPLPGQDSSTFGTYYELYYFKCLETSDPVKLISVFTLSFELFKTLLETT